MAKTTNILDLNNRLEKVEKENVAQNSYTSLKNKPKINGVTLTGNKSLADIGAVAADDTGWIQIGTSGVFYRKIGSMVTLRGTTQSSSGWATLCTLPNNLRPASDIMRAIRALGDYATLYITQSGDVNVQSNVSANLGFQESYLIG